MASEADDASLLDSTQQRSTIYIIATIAALAGLLFGMDIGIISGALPWIKKTFHIGDVTQEFIVSSMMLGAASGATASGWLSRKFGRKVTLTVSGTVYILGAIGCALAVSPAMLIATRVVLGLAVGISSYIAPVYLSEIAPERIRGTLISFYQLMIMGGIFVAYLVDAGFNYPGGWRWMLGVIAIPAAIMVLGMYILPRSPRWLANNQRRDKARNVLMRLRQDEETVDAEMARIQQSTERNNEGWQLFREDRNFRRSVGLGMLLQFMQQFTGANVILYYAPHILKMAGYSSSNEQMWGTVLIGLVMTLATLIAITFVDRVGRKPLLYIGFTVMGACMALLGVLYAIGLQSHPLLQYGALGFLAIFVISYAMSAAPMVWILCSEIQPLKGRDFGVACSTVTNWLSNFVIGVTFLSLLNVLGNANTFWLYAALNFLFILFTLLLIPETKGVSLEQIENNLFDGNRLRALGE
ncbi:sugar porter family MFS transporter [Salinisphaera sp. LB1]|uniref:sugar porter family MFS transporter n=1 Tax=Salinisphaera sp. LB1 TaxID=2183911 RepID=UPI000D7057C4|nr:sugar porter family MFS transporter [Salinisphaera sp. LB1]AWN16840.1 Arabinose-proton symporter [Salinisphaera sp. LB1]